MTQRCPARPGDAVDAIETPALIVDGDALERNVDALASALRDSGVRLRPHAKSHKCAQIAKLQVERGAIGICCQKTDEAIAFVDAGIADVLVTNEIVEPAKLDRLAAAARRATVGVLVDCSDGVDLASAAAHRAGTSLDLYVEVDVGAARCGVPPASAGDLAARIASRRNVRFAGLHGYHGAAQHLRSPGARTEAIATAQANVEAALRAIEAKGLRSPIVTGAGTGTWRLERDSSVWNELQPGSYVFMDADYAANTFAPGDLRFEHSLFVLSSVMSVPAPGRAVCDAGLKALAFDSGPPRVFGRDDLLYAKGSDEHGVLDVARGTPALRERLRLVPGHCDPTVNLYDWIVVTRGERVDAVWPVTARGALA